MESRPITLAFTIGDINGIGPEVLLKAVTDAAFSGRYRAVIFGPTPVLQHYLERLNLRATLRPWSEASPEAEVEETLWVVDPQEFQGETFNPGVLGADAGRVAGWALEAATEMALRGEADAVITAPISKLALKASGLELPGQTELFERLTGTEEVLMVLLSGTFRVGLVTTHCPLSEVAFRISRAKIARKLKIFDGDLRQRFGLAEPRIAVAALNPHAGEGGMFGREEEEIIMPGLRAARQEGVQAEGPFPADTLFARVDGDTYDGYLAMYHDQGLIPLKMKAFGRAVNYTAGLPIIRTSPDHGTAFDIAGQGVADAHSMMEAIKLAVELVSKTRGS